MSNYSSLYSDINSMISDPIQKNVLLEMVQDLGSGWQFKGVAYPTTNPGQPDEKVFYIAYTEGVYSYFSGLLLESGEFALFLYSSAWSKQSIPLCLKDTKYNEIVTDCFERTYVSELPDFVVGEYIQSDGTISHWGIMCSAMINLLSINANKIIIDGIGNSGAVINSLNTNRQFLSNISNWGVNRVELSVSDLLSNGATFISIGIVAADKDITYCECSRIFESIKTVEKKLNNANLFNYGYSFDADIDSSGSGYNRFLLTLPNGNYGKKVHFVGKKNALSSSFVAGLRAEIHLNDGNDSISDVPLFIHEEDETFDLTYSFNAPISFLFVYFRSGDSFVGHVKFNVTTELVPGFVFENRHDLDVLKEKVDYLLEKVQEVVCYCSSSEGNDTNTGLSEDSPLRTVHAALNLLSNRSESRKTIKLKRGDIFRNEGSIVLENINLSSYSFGKKPCLSHFAILSGINNTGPFTLVDSEKHIYGLNLAQLGDSFMNHNIGFIYNPETDSIVFGHKVNYYSQSDASNYQGTNPQGYSWLNNSGDFMQDGNTLYLKYDGTIGEDFSQLFFSRFVDSSDNAALKVSHCEVSDVRIEGYNFGILAAGDRSEIKLHNIEIDLIGGCSQNDGTNNYVRWGNGIEFWIDDSIQPNNIIVEHCKVSRVFDCGATIQGFLTNAATASCGAENIVFRGNLFFKCRQAYESFCSKASNNNFPLANCFFIENICVGCGDNEMFSPEIRDANLLSGVSGMYIGKNVFYGGRGTYYRHSSACVDFLRGNVFYVKQGSLLCNIVPSNTIVYYPVASDSTSWLPNCNTYDEAVLRAIDLYRTETGDSFSEFVEISDEDEIKNSPIIESLARLAVY